MSPPRGSGGGGPRTAASLRAAAGIVCLTLLSLPAHALPPPVAGPPALVLSELMINPTGDDLAGEWIEVFHLGDAPASLDGVWLDLGEVGALVPLPGTAASAPARSYLVLARGPYALPVWPAESCAVAVDVRLDGDALLPNSGGTLRLLWQDVVLDEVSWGGAATGALPSGAALNREPVWDRGGDPATASWCAARRPLAGAEEAAGDLGTPGAPNTWCDDDGDGFAEDEGDCDDGDPAVAPDALEICNGVDDDCDGVTDDLTPPPGVVCQTGGVCAGTLPRCDGARGWVCPYRATWEAVEVSCDGLDNDCDGETDEGLRNACGKCGAVLEDRCDGRDNDCDGETDEDAYADPLAGGTCPGEGVCAGAPRRCAGSEGWVCVWPPEFEAGEERTCDGLDNDCDGETDEPFALGAVCVVGRGACAATGRLVCAPDGASAVCDAVPAEPGPERCGNGFDDDCDGRTDEGFDVGAECVVGVGACSTRGKYVCSPDLLGTVCSATPPVGGVERCGNGRDDDCDGLTDESDCVTGGDGQPAPGTLGCAAAAPGPGGPGGPGAWPALVLLLFSLVTLARRALRR